MKIEHVAMYVTDIEAAKEFFIKYFKATANDMYHNKKTGFKAYFLTFEEGARLEIMTRESDLVVMDKPLTRTGYIHLCFALGSKEAVDTMTQQFKDDGYEVISGPRTTGDGYYESCIIGIAGNQIEITV